jgi:hypothetical protein
MGLVPLQGVCFVDKWVFCFLFYHHQHLRCSPFDVSLRGMMMRRRRMTTRRMRRTRRTMTRKRRKRTMTRKRRKRTMTRKRRKRTMTRKRRRRRMMMMMMLILLVRPRRPCAFAQTPSNTQTHELKRYIVLKK